MIRALFVCLFLLAGIWPALAQTSTGGAIGSVSSTSPALPCVTTHGSLSAVSCSLASPVQSQVGNSSYTAQTGDAGYQTKIGTTSGSPSFFVPQAGSTGFPANWQAEYVNVGAVPEAVSTSTSIFDGAGGGGGFSLAPNGSVTLTSETGGNWLAVVSTPTLTTIGPQIVQHPAVCANGGQASSETCTIAATGTPAHALTIVASACTNSNCSTTSNGSTLSITSPSGCTAISGTQTSGSNLGLAAFVCPNIAGGITSVTATASGTPWYVSLKVLEWSNVPTSAVTEAGNNNFNNGNTTTQSCTTGSTSNAADVIYATSYGPNSIIQSPFTPIDSAENAWGGDGYLYVSSTGTFTATFTSTDNYSFSAVCFGVKP